MNLIVVTSLIAALLSFAVSHVMTGEVQRVRMLNPVPKTESIEIGSSKVLEQMIQAHLRVGGTSILRVNVSDEDVYPEGLFGIKIVKSKGQLFLDLTAKNKSNLEYMQALRDYSASVAISAIVLALTAIACLITRFPLYIAFIFATVTLITSISKTNARKYLPPTKVGSPVPVVTAPRKGESK